MEESVVKSFRDSKTLRVVVVGGAGVGKSTLVRSVASSCDDVCVVDLDVGRSLRGPSSFVSIHYPDESTKRFVVGDFSINNCPVAFGEAVSECAAAVERCPKIIINTCGWISKALGIELVAHAAKSFGCDAVVSIGGLPIDLKNALKQYRFLAELNPVDVSLRHRESGSSHRARSTLEHFRVGDSIETFLSECHEVVLKDFRVVVHPIDDGVERSSLSALAGSVVGLNDDASIRECDCLGIVRSVDLNRKSIRIISDSTTPLSKKPRVVHLTKLKFPNHACDYDYDALYVDDDEIPFSICSNFFSKQKSARGVKRRRLTK